MLVRFLAALLSVLWLVGPALSANAADSPRVTDLVPQKSIASIFFRNINELRANGDQLFAKVGWPFPPTQLLSWAGQELKVNGLVDGNRPCGVAFFEFDGEKRPTGFVLPPAAAMFAIRDLDALAKRLGTTVDELKSGMTISSPGQLGYKNRHYRFSGDYLWIASEERLFAELSNRMPLNFAIAKSRRERMRNSDLVVSFRPTSRAVDRDKLVESGQRWIDRHPELSVEEQAAMRELFAVFEAMSNVVLGVHVHKDGVEIDSDVYFDFRKRKAVQTVLRRFNPTGAASSLHGLPGGTVLFSHALQADGKATLPALNALLPELTLTRHWRSIDDLEILTEAQQLKLLGLFGEVWRNLKGYRLAAYHNSNPVKYGLLSIVAILDTDNPQQVVSEVRELAEFIEGSQLFKVTDRVAASNDAAGEDAAGVPVLSDEGKARVTELVARLSSNDPAVRQSAAVRLTLVGEPVRPFVAALTATDSDVESVSTRQARRIISVLDKAKTRSGSESPTPRLLNGSSLRFQFSTDSVADSNHQVHQIEIEHKERTPKHKIVGRQMAKLFGPEWNRLRLVAIDNHLLVTIGSDPDLFRRTIASLEAEAQGLQTETSTAVYGPPLNAARGAEFHIALALIRDVLSQQLKPAADLDEAVPKSRSPAPETAPKKATVPSDAQPAKNARNATSTSEQPPIDFSSLSFTIQEDYLSIEWRLPATEIEAINAGT